MAEGIRLAVLGGSGVATPELIDALMQVAERPPVDIALIGRSAEKLDAVGAMCRRLAARATPPITLSTHTDPRKGLAGADYVLNQIRVGGYEARAYDETFPFEFGIPGEETVGPGGMNMALRTIPVVLDLCRAIESVAPGALMINLTNPSSIVQYAVTHYTEVQIVSVCDLPIVAAQTVAQLLNAPPGEVVVRYTGMNHFGWVTSVRWRGEELLPSLISRIGDYPGLPVEAEIVHALGVIPTSYFKYLYHPNRVIAAKQGKRPRAEELLELESQILAAYQSGDSDAKPPGLVERKAVWYEHMIVPTLLAHAKDSGEVHVLQVKNGQALPFLPPQAIVEVPCVVRRSGVLPLAYDDDLPPDLQALLHTNATFEMVWTEAVAERCYPKALRAALINPLITHYDQAKAILDTIWPHQEDLCR